MAAVEHVVEGLRAFRYPGVLGAGRLQGFVELGLASRMGFGSFRSTVLVCC